LIVTADSVNMCGEACATGRPVYVFTPSGGSPKFSRFHEALSAQGATRPLPDKFTELESWDYRPIDGAQSIASEIEKRYARRKHMLSGC
jgi:mitochondrial fission protein ELM1